MIVLVHAKKSTEQTGMKEEEKSTSETSQRHSSVLLPRETCREPCGGIRGVKRCRGWRRFVYGSILTSDSMTSFMASCSSK